MYYFDAYKSQNDATDGSCEAWEGTSTRSFNKGASLVGNIDQGASENFRLTKK